MLVGQHHPGALGPQDHRRRIDDPLEGGRQPPGQLVHVLEQEPQLPRHGPPVDRHDNAASRAPPWRRALDWPAAPEYLARRPPNRFRPLFRRAGRQLSAGSATGRWQTKCRDVRGGAALLGRPASSGTSPVAVRSRGGRRQHLGAGRCPRTWASRALVSSAPGRPTIATLTPCQRRLGRAERVPEAGRGPPGPAPRGRAGRPSGPLVVLVPVRWARRWSTSAATE